MKMSWLKSRHSLVLGSVMQWLSGVFLINFAWLIFLSCTSLYAYLMLSCNRHLHLKRLWIMCQVMQILSACHYEWTIQWSPVTRRSTWTSHLFSASFCTWCIMSCSKYKGISIFVWAPGEREFWDYYEFITVSHFQTNLESLPLKICGRTTFGVWCRLLAQLLL